jgi:transposase-like protein
MSNQRFSPEFKDEAVRQIVDRGYSVTEVSERLGVSAHSLYKWAKAIKPDKTDEQAANQEVLFEGLIYASRAPNLYLLAPKEANNDPTNIYSMSTGFLEKVAGLCGFELVETRYRRWTRITFFRKLRRLKPGYDRATMRFRRVANLTPAYKASCFSVAPKSLR